MQIASGVTFPFAIGADGVVLVDDASGSDVLLVTCIDQHVRCSTHFEDRDQGFEKFFRTRILMTQNFVQ